MPVNSGFSLKFDSAVLSDATLIENISNNRVGLIGVEDDFNDGVIGNRWEQVDANYPATEANGRMTVTLTSGASKSSGYITNIAVLSGDFDIEIGFNNFTATAPDSGGQSSLYFLFMISANDYFDMMYYRQQNNGTYIYRAYSYVGGSGQNASSASITTTVNRLRLVRSGTTVYMYYMSSTGWVLLHSRASFITDAADLKIYGFTYNTNATLTFNVTDLQVHSGSQFATSSPTVTLPKIGGGSTGCKWVWDGSSLVIPENIGLSGAIAAKYKFGLFDDDAESDLSWNADWLAIADLKTAIGTTTEKRWLKIMAQLNSSGSIGSNIGVGHIATSYNVSVGSSYLIDGGLCR